MMNHWAEPFISNNIVYRKFKEQQLEAERLKMKQYYFDGQEMLTKFGKYLLIYVENQRKQKGLQIWKVK